MKPKFYLIALALLSSAISASASSLTIRFNRPSSFIISIDGYDYNVKGREFYLPDIRPGNHKLMISSMPARQNPYRNPMPEVLYRGNILLHPHAMLSGVLDQRGFYIDGEQYEDKRNHGYDERRGRNGRYERNDDYQNYNDKDGRRNYNSYYMNPADFEMLKQSLHNASFESTRKSLAMTAISNNSLSIQQLKEVLMQFDFESTKVEVARYAFNYSDDKQNFYLVSDAFTFDSSKREIAELSRR
jgi:hypothetical protein